MIAAIAGVLLIALQQPIFWAAFQMAPASAEVEALAREYMAVRLWSAPAAIAIYGIGGWLVARERTSGLFWLQLWSNGLNIVLSMLFVLRFGWGIEGVALATVISEWTGLALGLFLTRDGFQGRAWRDWPRVFDAARLWHMASVNTDILIRSVILMAGFTSFLYIGADFGDTVLAANQILLQFLYITAYAMDGFAFAAEALVGQALGARRWARLRRGALLTSGWGAVICLVLSAVFFVAGPALIDLLTGGFELSFRPFEIGRAAEQTAEALAVQAEARSYLLWMVAAPVLGCASWMLDGIFIGATRARDMRNMMILSSLVYLAALADAGSGLWQSRSVGEPDPVLCGARGDPGVALSSAGTGGGRLEGASRPQGRRAPLDAGLGRRPFQGAGPLRPPTGPRAVARGSISDAKGAQRPSGGSMPPEVAPPCCV